MSSFVLTLLTWPPLIALAGLLVLALLARRFSFGCVLTVVSVVLAMSIMVGIALGHCVPSENVTCPTPLDLKVTFYGVGVGTLLANVLMWIRIARRRPQTGEL